MDLAQDFREALRDGAGSAELRPKPVETWTGDYAIWRFLKALRESPSAHADHAVLLRQALRWSGILDAELSASTTALRRYLPRAGVSILGNSTLRVLPFRPTWASDIPGTASTPPDAPPTLQLIDETEPSEAWLHMLRGHRSWRSPAQKEACWTALTAPEGSTTLVALPTGAGKSLIFQTIARFSQGLTVVIVPTVALALDHMLGATNIFADIPAFEIAAYEAAAGNENAVRDGINDGSIRLLFASPEACVSGSLHYALTEAATRGWLQTLVVDEAHIVETWGADFRVDFQLLGNALTHWRELSRQRLRTVLLSATFSVACRRTLKDLFARGDLVWREFVSQRLRPEMNYYVGGFEDDAERKKTVHDALWHLPRPAILYATEVQEATELFEAIRQEQHFERVECFTGETGRASRRAILEAWRADELDLVVATSAFGLGVDKPDVRAVVHACVPETLDRYYQEVGRGGRDGASATCVWLPCGTDWRVARSLTPTLLGDEKIRLRWDAMWKEKTMVRDRGPDVFQLPLNVRGGHLLGVRSHGENVRWNKRLLLLMARADLLDLIGSVQRDAAREGEAVADESVTVRVRFATLSEFPPQLRDRRDEELKRADDAHAMLQDYAIRNEAICQVLRRQYGPETDRACGSCPTCRVGKASPASCRPLAVPGGESTRPRLELVMGLPDFRGSAGRDAVVMLLRDTLRRVSIRRFFCVPDALADIRAAFADAFGDSGSELYRIDGVTAMKQACVAVDEHVVCIHALGYSSELEALNGMGRVVSHWVPSGRIRRDANGRLPLISDGAHPYLDVIDWLRDVARIRPSPASL